MTKLRGVAIGAGYFSQFYYDAWHRNTQASLVCVCGRDRSKAEEIQAKYAIPSVSTSFANTLDEFRPDFVDIITPPASHLEIVRAAAERGIHVLCQKPLAPTLEEAIELVQAAESTEIRLMVHENFRFQPWHREIKRILSSGDTGDAVHSMSFRTRTGDGWGADAYLGRQPYFRHMPRLLIFETGIHFIDMFRYLAGEIARVTCFLRRLNPVIAGEDFGLMLLEFASGWPRYVGRKSLQPGECGRSTFDSGRIPGRDERRDDSLVPGRPADYSTAQR